MTDDVIIIDSSDSDNEIEAMITDDMKLAKSNNNNMMGEILFSVQTVPIEDAKPLPNKNK